MPASYPFRKLLLAAMAISTALLFSCGKDSGVGTNTTQPLSADEYIHYTVNGIAYGYDKPADHVFADDSLENQSFIPQSKVSGTRIPASATDFARMEYLKTGSAAGSKQPLSFFASPKQNCIPTQPLPPHQSWRT